MNRPCCQVILSSAPVEAEGFSAMQQDHGGQAMERSTKPWWYAVVLRRLDRINQLRCDVWYWCSLRWSDWYRLRGIHVKTEFSI